MCIYLNFFKMTYKTILAFTVLFSFLYFCVGAVGKSRKKLKEYEERLTHSTFDKKDYKSVLWNFITLLSPTYFAAFLVSFIPLYSYEVWFAVVFPCVIINCVAFFNDHILSHSYYFPATHTENDEIKGKARLRQLMGTFPFCSSSFTGKPEWNVGRICPYREVK